MDFKILLIALLAVVVVSGCMGDNENNGDFPPPNITSLQTFSTQADPICTMDEKPVIRNFAMTTCSHCNWVKETYLEVARDYKEQGLVEAHLWVLDTGDDLLTPEIEQEVPQSELDIYENTNPRRTVPTFVFGCKYYRIGTGYEHLGDAQGLAYEEAEFEFVIDKILGELESEE